MIAGGERGQTSAEYVGLLLVVAAVVGAIVTFGIAGSITDGIRDALCTLTGGQCEKAGASAGAMPAAELVAREQALTGLAARGAS